MMDGFLELINKVSYNLDYIIKLTRKIWNYKIYKTIDYADTTGFCELTFWLSSNFINFLNQSCTE